MLKKGILKTKAAIDKNHPRMRAEKERPSKIDEGRYGMTLGGPVTQGVSKGLLSKASGNSSACDEVSLICES